MKIILPVSAFFIWVLSGLCFAGNWGGVNDAYYIDDYTYGELVYQMGIEMSLFLGALYARLNVSGWKLKLLFNFMCEVLLISCFFMLKNPYSINWDKVMMLKLCIGVTVCFYSTCWAFPSLRKAII